MNIKLLQLREEKNLSQEEVAAILGVTRQAYSRYERGERELGYDALSKLAHFFDVSIDYLLGQTEYYYPDKLNNKLSDREYELIVKYRELSPELQSMLWGIMGTWSGESIKQTKKL